MKSVSVTLRVPADVKSRVEEIALDMGISQSAVWKILIANHLRPALRRSAPPAGLLPTSQAEPAPRPPVPDNEPRRLHVQG